jgi:hypothetical protein
MWRWIDRYDSRVAAERHGVGFVPQENPRDRPIFILWSADWRRIGAALD